MSIYSVSLSPGSENVNTFGGEVIFPQDWQLTRIISSYESVRYWIRSPQVTDPGTIAYSGLFPGGLTEALGEGHDQGQDFVLFYVEFDGEIVPTDLAQLTQQNSEIYLNEPRGAVAQEAHFSVSALDETASSVEDRFDPILLDYNFITNPLTNQQQLYWDVYDDSGASTQVEVREGGAILGEWKLVDGNYTLESSDSPVDLRITDETGNQTNVALRSSFWPDGFIYTSLAVLFLFNLFLAYLLMRRKK